MSRVNIILHIEMEWEFGNAELNNLFDDATINLPNGEEIKNIPTQGLPIVECIAIMKGADE